MSNKAPHGLSSDEVAGAAAGAVPIVGPLLAPLASLLAGAVTEEWRRNTSTALDAAERLSGLSREDLAEVMDRDRRLVPLLTRVLYQAGMSGGEDKLHALGACLGTAVKDTDRLDEADVLLSSLDRLTSRHIAVLRMMTEEPPPFDDTPDVRCAWSGYNIPKRAGLTTDVGAIVLSGLLNAGMVRRAPTYDGADEYQPSALGNLLLDVLTALADAEGGDPGQGKGRTR